MKDKNSIQVKIVPLERIKPFEKNPRVMNPKAIESVANSIKEFGFNVPIVVNSEMKICCGHTRYEAAKLLGLKKVPVIIRDMDEKDFLSYNIIDNKTSELNEWNFEMLRKNIQDLDKDLTEFGFTEEDLDIILSSEEELCSFSEDELPEYDKSLTEDTDKPEERFHCTIFFDSKEDWELLAKLSGKEGSKYLEGSMIVENLKNFLGKKFKKLQKIMEGSDGEN